MDTGHSGETVRVEMSVLFDVDPATAADPGLRERLSHAVGELLVPVAADGHVAIRFRMRGETTVDEESELPDLADDPRAHVSVYELLNTEVAQRLGNALAGNGLFTVRDILAAGRERLLGIRHVGQDAIVKIGEALERLIPEAVLKTKPNAQDYVRLYRDIAEMPARLVGSGELSELPYIKTVGDLLAIEETELRALIAADYGAVLDRAAVAEMQDTLVRQLNEFEQAFEAAELAFRGE